MSTDGALKLVPAAAPDAAPPDAPAGLAWISQEEARVRLGDVNIGSVRRLCLEQWAPAGRARKARNPATGRETWEIHESADPRLLPVKTSTQLAREFDRNALPAKQRAVYDFRKGVLDRWDQVRAGAVAMGQGVKEAQRRFCEHLGLEGAKVSPRTLDRWAGLARKGPEFLVDGRTEATAAAQDARAADPFLQAVARLWLRESKPKLKTCHDHVAQFVAPENGWIVPSLKTTERHIKSLPPQLVIEMREGKTAYKNKVLPHQKRGYADLAPNDWWCSDHHQFDVFVETGRDKDDHPTFARPWLTVWQDLRSRKIVAHAIYAHAPNQTAVLHTFRAASLAVGLPHNVLIDNGKDYDCYTLQGLTKQQRRKLKVDIDSPSRGVMGHLQVNVTHAIPFNARAKPVERFFGTVCTRFSKFVPCYCGRNPQEKPESLPADLKAGCALTLDDFARRFGLWLEADYHAKGHAGDAMGGALAPSEAFERFKGSVRTVSREAMELLIQRTSQPLSVGPNGVSFDGLTYGMDQIAQLAPYYGRGKQLYLRVDPDDVTRATAWTLDDRLVGLLTANGAALYGPVRDEAKRRAQTAIKRARELQKQYHEEVIPYRHADVLDVAALQQRAGVLTARAAAEARTLPAPSLRLVQDTPAEQQARQLEDLRARQQAAPPSPPAEPGATLYDDVETPDMRPARGPIDLYGEED